MSATIHFIIRTDRPLSDKSVQIYLRFTINRKLKTKISLGKKIPIKKEFANLHPSEIAKLSPEIGDSLYEWDCSTERALKTAPNAKQINIFLDAEKKRANDIILKHEILGKPLTIETFKKLFSRNTGNLLFSEYFLNEFKIQSNRWSSETLRSNKSIVTKILKFRPSLSLNEIDYRFLTEYENYMLKPRKDGGCGNCPNTVANNLKVLKTLLKIAVKNGDLHSENLAFNDYQITDSPKELTTRDYLEPEEIRKLEELYSKYSAPSKPQEELTPEEWRAREDSGIVTPGEYKTLKRFLFSCYTGLRFRDVMALETEMHIFFKNIEIPSTGNKISRYYIEIKMHKTQNPVVIPLIDKALALINLDRKGRVFEAITNQKVNEHLKSIQKKAKLNKHLTFHVSRHSFATICFLYGIHEKVGQQLLGHKNRKFTEIYTHLSSHKLFLEMDKFNEGMNKLGNAVIPVSVSDEAKILELLPLLKNMDSQKLEQLKGILKLLG